MKGYEDRDEECARNVRIIEKRLVIKSDESGEKLKELLEGKKYKGKILISKNPYV